MSGGERFAVLGTAGHIDHGKTALVGLLTGVDTDRLKEEKARGISIDLGFAHLSLPGGLSCGIVDVPGHERFVKNMLAGACGIDAVLLVIAADEGVMPQTREHVDIVRLLGVEHGVVALTKIDMVEPEWRDLVTESVGEYLAEQGLGGFAVVPVSSRTGEGKDAVLAALAHTLDGIPPRASAGKVRLPVDRAFSVEGFGTVVTGTLWQGEIRPGDRLRVEPGGHDVRVRNVEVHGEKVEVAHPGQRTAVALHGVERDEVPRGTWLLAPDTLGPTHMLDVRLRVLPDAPRPVRRRQRIRFHLGASEILGRIVPLETEELEPGGEGLAQLRLEGEAVADRGDRFVIRSYSPARAVAGGTVIVPRATKHKLSDPDVVGRLEREETGSDEERLAAVLAEAPGGLAMGEAAAAAGLDIAAVRRAVETLGEAVESEGDHLVSREAVDALEEEILRALADGAERFPYRWGLGRGEVKRRLPAGVPLPLFDRLVTRLVEKGRIQVQRDLLRAGEGDGSLPPAAAARLEQVRSALDEGGVAPPTLRELEKSVGVEAGEILDRLTFEGGVEKVSADLFLARTHLDRIGSFLRKSLADNGSLAVGDLKEGLGLSRKYSVPILEYFDRIGWTRRQGDVRVAGRQLGNVPRE